MPKRRKNCLKTLSHVGRLILFILTLAVLTGFYIWHQFPQLVHTLDKRVVTFYTSVYLKRLMAIQAATRKAQGLSDDDYISLLSLSDDLAQIQKFDRLDPIKRACFDILAQYYHDKGRPKDALRIFEEWIAFDRNDLNAQVKQIRFMSHHPRMLTEAKRKMSALLIRFPYGIVLDTFEEMLAAGHFLPKDLSRSLAKAYMIDRAANTRKRRELPWEFFWDTGSGFSPLQSRKIVPQWKAVDLAEFSISLPAATQNFRIDPPANLRLALVAPELSFFTLGAPPLRSPLTALSLQFNEVTPTGKGVLTIRNAFDPYVVVKMPIPSKTGGQVKIDFETYIFPFLFQTIDRFNLGGEVAHDLKALGTGALGPPFTQTLKNWISQKERSR